MFPRLAQIKLAFSPLAGGRTGAGGDTVVRKKGAGTRRSFCAGVTVVVSFAIIGTTQIEFCNGAESATPRSNAFVRAVYGIWEPQGLSNDDFNSKFVYSTILTHAWY